MTLRTVAPGQYALDGDVGMDSVASLHAGLSAALQGGNATLDLSGLGKVDSAAIALLLDALRHQQQKGGTLQLQHVPDSLRVLAELYELAPLLGLTKEATP